MKMKNLGTTRGAVRRIAGMIPAVIILPLLLPGADQPWTGRQVREAQQNARVQITPPGSFDQSTCKHAEGISAVRFPQEGPGWPGYANFYAGFIPNDGTWAGLTFFRHPSCVRADFNLLEFVDIPAVLGCPLNITGVNFSTEGADFPFEVKATLPRGATTPIYFALWAELQTAIADGVLTIGELRSLPSLRIGLADKLEFHVLNSNAPCGDGNGHEYFQASGYLQDGRKFHFSYEEMFLPGENLHVFPRMKIKFTPPGDDNEQ